MKASELRVFIEGGGLDERILDIYADESLTGYQKDRYTGALDKFIELYGDKEVSIYSAPGRSEVGGFDAFMTGNVPMGAGLSSSAAFEVVTGTILSGIYNGLSLDAVYIAKASQYAENRYFGKPCGLMDQMASSVGGLVNIDFADPEDPVINPVKVDFDGFKKLISESGSSSYKYLQNVYSNSDVDNQSISVALALTEKILGTRGAYRVHGGGFAGTIQVFVPNDIVEEYREKIEKVFGKGSCHVLKIRKYGGMLVK
ncbi:MAG: hypothetical protein K6F34_08935 [Lachnospiraceae bacterium]|nr:hypothetical protein [Lachnospiraceae bacterium]